MRNYIIYILFLVVSTSSFAQKDSLIVQYDKSIVKLKKFDQEHIETYKNDRDFDYLEVKEESSGVFKKVWYWFKRILSKIFSWIFGVERATGILALLLEVIPYFVLVVVLLLLLKFFLKINTNSLLSGKTNNAKVIMTEDEDIIHNKDISELIRKAVAQKNYRLAVRYHYLLILQGLQENNLIEWEPQKTNEDYIKEIKQKTVISTFKDITYLYDFVWYGNFEINELEFVKVEADFKKLTANLK